MLSPAKRHFQQAKAAKEAAEADANPQRQDLSQYQLMQAQLHTHQLQLKGIQSQTKKIALKAQLLPEYEPHITGVLEADSNHQDDVFMTMLVWYLDVANWDKALTLARHAIKHNLTMPDRFARKLEVIIAEEVAENLNKGDDIALAQLNAVYELVGQADMPDQVKAKLLKALGLHPELQETQPQTALNYLQTAVSLNDRIGVKPEIKKLEKRLEEQNKP